MLRRKIARAGVLGACAATALAPSWARADEAVETDERAQGERAPTESPQPSAEEAAARAKAAEADWRRDYDRTREKLLAGHFAEAEAELRDLAERAPSDLDRSLALEMAGLAETWAAQASSTRPVRPTKRLVRTTDELTLLYTTSFLYGAGTGAWFLLQTQPSSALTATAPFAALTAAPIIAVATVDGVKKLPRGVPHSISAGAALGLGQGIWLSGYGRARARRIHEADAQSSVHWGAEESSSVMWAGATLGAALGGVLGSTLVTTPGRVSYVSSVTAWSGIVTGLGAGALVPEGRARDEAVFLTGGAGYNAGLAVGMWSAGLVSPSVARVRLVDLTGVAGGLSTAALYLSLTRDADAKLSGGLAAAGAVTGLAVGWWATSGMPADRPGESRPAPPVSIHPTVHPVQGGAALGLVGAM